MYEEAEYTLNKKQKIYDSRNNVVYIRDRPYTYHEPSVKQLNHQKFFGLVSRIASAYGINPNKLMKFAFQVRKEHEKETIQYLVDNVVSEAKKQLILNW